MIRRVAAALRRVAIDVEPLRRSPDFRRLWSGLAVSEFGYQFTLVATFVQVFDLTGSSAAVGTIGLVGLVSLAGGTLGASAFLDHRDRRSLLMLSQIGLMTGTAVLLVTALVDRPPLAAIYLGVAIIGLFSSIDSPTRAAMTPRLVGRELVPSAITLNQVVWNSTALIGPAAAGFLIARTGVSWAYALDLLTYPAMLWAAARLRPMPPEDVERSSRGLAAVREGFAYLRGRPVLQSTFVVDIIAMVFGMPRALFPVLAVTQFDRGAEVVGLLLAAPAVGALAGVVTAGWVRSVRRQGLVVIWAVIGWGAGIAAFGLVGDRLIPALVLLAVAGAADVISAVFRNTILQSTVPEGLRGRLSAIHVLVVTGGPRLGDFEAGLVASLTSPQFSVVSGGVLCILGTAALAVLVPSFRRYRSDVVVT